MFTLARARRAMGDAGEPLPPVFRTLAARDFHFRRGQLVAVAAGPGVGKSILSQNIAQRSRCPTLYFSADSDAFTMYLRGAAIATGHNMKDIERSVNAGQATYYDNALNAIQHIRYDYNPSPNADDIDEAVDAFALVYGEYPHLIVIDNLKNVDADDLAETNKIEAVMLFLKTLAHRTNSCVVMLHHLTGQYTDGKTMPPMSALIDKVDKIPEGILMLWIPGHGSLGVNVVKNRTGERDVQVYLEYAPAYARLEDLK